jgi:AAA+ ATPase superfamily predicted ATPase
MSNESGSAELSVVYGRRRMGKTALVVKSIEDRDDAVYHQAAHGTTEQQLDSFIADAATVFPGVSRIRKDWENVLTYLAEQDAVVILDEFPYLVDENEALPSLIQRIWDHEVADTAATFVLTGSAIGMIHKIALDGSSPLYGRISKRPNGNLETGPLPFVAAMEFFPNYTPAEQVIAYGVFGGTPEYLRAVDDTQSLRGNITETLLLRDGGLHEEPEDVLYRELDEVDRYFAVLKAMAEGNHKRNEIIQAAGINANSASYYLSRLRELRIVEQEYPVTVDRPGVETAGIESGINCSRSGSGSCTAVRLGTKCSERTRTTNWSNRTFRNSSVRRSNDSASGQFSPSTGTCTRSRNPRVGGGTPTAAKSISWPPRTATRYWSGKRSSSNNRRGTTFSHSSNGRHPKSGGRRPTT